FASRQVQNRLGTQESGLWGEAFYREGDSDALENVSDDRLDRLYAAKAYLQSDAATANSDAYREVVREIADEEFDLQKDRLVDSEHEGGPVHG
ncbi:MAG: hypothetical protein AAGJ50_15545, partial [Pseudomonadota bacterium]